MSTCYAESVANLGQLDGDMQSDGVRFHFLCQGGQMQHIKHKKMEGKLVQVCLFSRSNH